VAAPIAAWQRNPAAPRARLHRRPERSGGRRSRCGRDRGVAGIASRAGRGRGLSAGPPPCL